MARYQSEYRGVVQYYLLAQNVSWLWKLHWVMRTSLLKTLAHKHRCSVAKMARRYQAMVVTPHGLMKCLQITVPRDGKAPLVARFGVCRCSVSLRQSIPTCWSRPRESQRGASYSSGFWPTRVNCAARPSRWKSITFASWPISTNQDKQPSHGGCRSWRPGDGRRLSSAAIVTRQFTPVAHTVNHSEHDGWKAV